MNPHAGAVDHLDIAIVSLSQRVHNPVPDAGLGPATEAVVAGRLRPVPLRQIRPGRARAQHPEYPVEHAPVVHPRHPARLVRQKRFNDGPFEIGQIVASHGQSSLWPAINLTRRWLGIPSAVYEFTA